MAIKVGGTTVVDDSRNATVETATVTGDMTVATEVLHVDASEASVGINTTSPDEALHVVGGGTGLKLQGSGTAASGGITFWNGGSSPSETGRINNNAGAGRLEYYADPQGVKGNSKHNFYVDDTSTAKFQIDSTKIQGNLPFHGDGSNLTGTGSMVMIESLTADDDAALDIEGFSTDASEYSEYRMVLSNMLPATDGAELWMRYKIGGSYITSTSYKGGRGTERQSESYVFYSDNNANGGALTRGIGTAMTGGENGASGHVNTQVPTTFTGDSPKVVTLMHHLDSSSTPRNNKAEAFWINTGTTGRLEGIRFLMNTGNITSGTITLYGVKR